MILELTDKFPVRKDLHDSEKDADAINLEDIVADSNEESMGPVFCSESDHSKICHLRRSSYWNQTRLSNVGLKDIYIVFFLTGLGIFWSLIYWSFSLNNKRRTVPPNITITAASAWEAVLQVNGTFFCSSNTKLPFNTSEYNDAAINTISKTFYEIAVCLGWNKERLFGSVVLYLSLVVRYNLTTIIIFYKITNIQDFRVKSIGKRLTIIWLALTFIFVVARRVGDIMDSHAIFLTIYCLAIPIILSRKAMRRMSIEYHIDLRWYFA